MTWFHAHLVRLRQKLTTVHGILYLGALVGDVFFVVLGVYLVCRYERRIAPNRETFPSFLQYMFPKDVFLHKSALLDYQIKLLQSLIGFPFSFPALLGVATIATWFYDGGFLVLGPAHPGPTAPLWVMLGCGVLVALVYDFTNYSAHVILHKVPLFWEFHKVHHAAEVLTPITVDRTHPLEDVPKIVIATFLCAAILSIVSRFYPIDVDTALLYGGDLLVQ